MACIMKQPKTRTVIECRHNYLDFGFLLASIDLTRNSTLTKRRLESNQYLKQVINLRVVELEVKIHNGLDLIKKIKSDVIPEVPKTLKEVEAEMAEAVLEKEKLEIKMFQLLAEETQLQEQLKTLKKKLIEEEKLNEEEKERKRMVPVVLCAPSSSANVAEKEKEACVPQTLNSKPVPPNESNTQLGKQPISNASNLNCWSAGAANGGEKYEKFDNAKAVNNGALYPKLDPSEAPTAETSFTEKAQEEKEQEKKGVDESEENVASTEPHSEDEEDFATACYKSCCLGFECFVTTVMVCIIGES